MTYSALQELLEKIFGSLLAAQEFEEDNALSYAFLMRSFGRPPFKQPLAALLDALNITEANKGSISADDFFDYYVDVAAELPADQDVRFEELLKETWSA